MCLDLEVELDQRTLTALLVANRLCYAESIEKMHAPTGPMIRIRPASDPAWVRREWWNRGVGIPLVEPIPSR